MFESIPQPDGSNLASLLEKEAASMIGAADASVFGLDDDDFAYASRFMGWTRLAARPPFDPRSIDAFAEEIRGEGLDDVILIGQGGSTQASMTMAALLKAAGKLHVRFHTMDSLAVSDVRAVLDTVDPARTMFIVSSKSGSTIEPNAIFSYVWAWVALQLGEDTGSRFIAITDPGSSLEEKAHELGFRAVFPGEPEVGGRFSALSVFGLVPFSLMGIDVAGLLDRCSDVERACRADDADNPAARLAAFIVDQHDEGRDKIAFHFDEGCRALGFWLEQLIAESLGKQGLGILPGTENDLSLLSVPRDDRCAVLYSMEGAAEEAPASATAVADLGPNAEHPLDVLDPSIPAIELPISEPEEVAGHFVVWEYAVSLIAVLLGVNPYDQPDVESTKREVRRLLGVDEAADEAPAVTETADDAARPLIEVSDALLAGHELPQTEDEALDLLQQALEPGDYVSINAFGLPVDEFEELRHEIARTHGCVACLEIGPRYLHSIGQFQKGGPNTGVFLIVSADQPNDLDVPGQSFTLGGLATAQAFGDFKALAAQGRRVIHIHRA